MHDELRKAALRIDFNTVLQERFGIRRVVNLVKDFALGSIKIP
jgi:hypothetical protein